MPVVTQLPDDKKLHVLFRVEPGCMGPAGIDHIQDYCKYAQQRVQSLHAEFVKWEIVARMNKKLPEMQFRALNKNLTHDQAEKYLAVFGQNLEEFEEHLHDMLALLVDEFWEKDVKRGL
ncbi:hypothetical protein [Planctobacterium marinum]|uniref:Uncharacterized protein n=1 Tax=Planctobacterium marinum TaxID=1631968 RepID=A0AA48HIJ4_9ALTE|nr:hypothetical protein MACH26_30740 [Planctobacterium marinum]